MSTTDGFGSLLLNLGARVRKLHIGGSKLRVADLEKEIGKCESLLGALHDQAVRDSIDLCKYYEPLVDIQGRLGDLRLLYAKRRQPWWRRIYRSEKFHLLSGGLI